MHGDTEPDDQTDMDSEVEFLGVQMAPEMVQKPGEGHFLENEDARSASAKKKLA